MRSATTRELSAVLFLIAVLVGPVAVIDCGEDTQAAAGTGGTSPPNQPPTAKLTAYPLLGEVPRTVDFDASGSTDPDGDSLRYSWKILGGGDPVVTTTLDWSHLFDQAGDYDVLLTVFDTHGASAMAPAAVSFAPPALTNVDFEEASGGLPVGWSTGEWRHYRA